MDYIYREIPVSNWQTILVIICLGLLAVAKKVNGVQFSHFVMFYNANKYNALHHNSGKISSLFNTILILFQALSVSMFVYLSFKVFDWQVPSKDIMLYTKIVIIYTVILIFKILIEKIIAALFTIDSVIDEYLLYKISWRNFVALILLPVTIVFMYSVQLTKVLFISILVSVLLGNIVVYSFYYKKNEKTILNNKFYFILYLCTLEIAPYFILYKLIN